MSGLLEKRHRRPELNLVPLIDVLVMLIFFAFVTMQFKSAAALDLTLPKINSAGHEEYKGTITVSIDRAGIISLNGRAVADDELLSDLRQIQNTNKDIPVLIRADEGTPFKRLTFVWDACGSVGLSNFQMQSR